MKRLPPDKRNNLILVIVITLGLIGLVQFSLIHPQKEQNQKLAADTAAHLVLLKEMKAIIKQADVTAAKVGDVTQQLASTEEDEATGDVFAWTYDTIRQFKTNRHVEIVTIGQPTLSDEDLIANFPYKQIKFQLIGNGFYTDIGKFCADLENKFPHMRIVSLTIDTASGPETAVEKLSFRMEIAALVKPNA